MTFSTRLQRHIDVPIEQLNSFDTAELDAALSALPGYPDCAPADIRRLASEGDLNAVLVIERARAGDAVAQDWV